MTGEKDRTPPDEGLGKRARELFDESVDALDAAALSRLNRNRHAVLAGRAGRRPLWPALLPAGTVAAVAMLVYMTGEPGPRPVEQVQADAVADFEILLAGDDFEMLVDLEFYSWVELEPETAANVG